MKMTSDIAVPASVLAISAHPDDSELQAGGTLAKWAAAGSVISIVVCTDGSKGTWNPHADLDSLIATRRDEQRAAAAALGARGTIGFCGWVDGELEHSVANVRRITEWIRRVRPAIVMTHDPWKRYRLHPDHRTAGFLVTDAVVAARDPHFHPDIGPSHHRPDELWFFEADEPNHVESVGGWLDSKHRALLCHETQLESTMGITAAERDAGVARFRADLSAAAEAAASSLGLSGSLVESFARLTDL